MQNPDTGEITALESLFDSQREGKEHWPTYEVGEKVRFRGWWWEIVAINNGQLVVEPRNKASINEVQELTRALEKAKKREAACDDNFEKIVRQRELAARNQMLKDIPKK